MGMGRRVVGAGSIEPPPFNPRNQIGARQLTDVPTCFFYKLSPLFCGWKNGGLGSRATLMDKELIVKCVINGRLRQSPQCLVSHEHSTLLPSAFLFPHTSWFCFKSLRCQVGFKLRISLLYTQNILCWRHLGRVIIVHIKASVMIDQWKLIVAIGADFMSTRHAQEILISMTMVKLQRNPWYFLQFIVCMWSVLFLL